MTLHHQKWNSSFELLVIDNFIIFRTIYNIQEKLFIQYSVQWGQFFLSDQNCQLFLFKNKWEQYG